MGRVNMGYWATHRFFWKHLSLLLVAAVAGVGCDSMARLKARLHTAPDVHGASDPVEPGMCGLDVVVTPPTGMTVLVDGAPLGHTSPACHRSLEPGPHTVYVRAMGYNSIALPVTLSQGEVLRLPVALRARAPAPFTGAIAEVGPNTARTNAVAPAREAAGSGERPRARPTPQPALATRAVGSLLPEGSSPVSLHLVAQPTAAIVVDNEASDGRHLRLRQPRGTLAIGNIVLTYIISPGRTVDFLVPSDGALWFRDGAQVKPGSVLRLGRGLLRLRRVPTGGAEQAVVLRRIG